MELGRHKTVGHRRTKSGILSGYVDLTGTIDWAMSLDRLTGYVAPAARLSALEQQQAASPVAENAPPEQPRRAWWRFWERET